MIRRCTKTKRDVSQLPVSCVGFTRYSGGVAPLLFLSAWGEPLY